MAAAQHHQPTWDRPYLVGSHTRGPDGERAFGVEVKPGFGNSDLYMVTIVRGNTGSSVQPEIRDWEVACALADHLYAVLLPEHHAEVERLLRRDKEWEAERLAQLPAQRKAAAKALAAARKAPKVQAAQCPECGHLEDHADAYETPAYECSTCGTTGIGEDGRRCEQCHKFCAKVADLSCPACEMALESAPELVAARKLPAVMHISWWDAPLVGLGAACGYATYQWLGHVVLWRHVYTGDYYEAERRRALLVNAARAAGHRGVAAHLVYRTHATALYVRRYDRSKAAGAERVV